MWRSTATPSSPPQRRGRVVGQQRPVRQEVPARQLGLDQRPVTLAARAAARADRARPTPVGVGRDV